MDLSLSLSHTKPNHRHAGRPLSIATHPSSLKLVLIYVEMLFSKQVVVFASLLLGTLASAVVIPMPMANEIAKMKLRDVKMISAYEKRQDIVAIGDSTPVKAPDGVVQSYPRQVGDIVSIGDSVPVKAPTGVVENYPRQAADVVTIGDSVPVKAPTGVVENYPRQAADVVTIGDSVPVKAPTGVVENYPRQAADVVTIGDSTPVKAPAGVVESYPRRAIRKELPRMRRTRSSKRHA